MEIKKSGGALFFTTERRIPAAPAPMKQCDIVPCITWYLTSSSLICKNKIGTMDLTLNTTIFM